MLLVGALVVAVVEAFALMALIPLKERVPYFLEVERVSGRVVVSSQAAKSFVPDENNKRYFISEWVKSMFAIDQLRTKELLLPRAKAMTRGKATTHYSAWLAKDQTIERMVESQKLSRSVEVKSISFVPGAENVVMVRAVFRVDEGGGVSREEGRVITLNYALIPPQTDDEILRNPIGLFVTEFNVDNEVIQ